MLVIAFFAVYLLAYLFLMTSALSKHPELREASDRFIPPIGNLIPGFSYLGFILPLGVALGAIMLLLMNARTSKRKLQKLTILKQKWWVLAASLCAIMWYMTPGFASHGHTDFPLALLACAYVGWTLRKGESLTRRFLLSAAMGFGIGFVSDLQSQAYFIGIFGGWGLLDGDVLIMAALPLATISAMIFLGFYPGVNLLRQ